MARFPWPRIAGAATAALAGFAVSGCVSVTDLKDDHAAASAIGVAAARAATAAVGAATTPAAPGHRPATGATTVAVAAAAQAAAQAASGQRAFADVVDGWAETAGLFRIHAKDEKVYLEIAPEQFGKPFFLTSGLNRGIGENRLFGGMMTYPAGLSQVVEFRRAGPLVQLVAKNVKYTANPGTPEARGVAAGFSDSLLAATSILSQPHPERRSVLVDASSIFVADLPAAATFLERTYRQSYSFDGRNSTLTRARVTGDLATFEVNAHYALARPVVPAPGTASTASLPSTVPDPRSLFLGFHYSLGALPDKPMRPRLADERLGFFTTERLDFSADSARVPVVRYVDRWRLEKKDPAAERSEPRESIVFWLDRNIPEKYREPVRAGILEWNKAFERIGFVNAIRVMQQPDDADFDTSDLRHASVRWLSAARTAFGAIGPSVVDPRSGEILDADIGIDANNVRVVRNLRAELVPRTVADAPAAADALACAFDRAATGEAVFGLSLLEARGELGPDDLEVDAFVAAFVKGLTMHEIGHALGLSHNFRASTIYSEAQLADPAFTSVHGISGSVMDYNPWNLALRGEPQGAYQMTVLGPYDYWAIEYAYRELPPESEADLLARIASRSSEPQLAFASGDDASVLALDPQINPLDLGDDPLAFARKRFALVRELFDRTEGRRLGPGESYAVLRRNFSRGLAEATQGAVHAAKYIGGLTTLNDRAGSGRDPLTPVPSSKQREALALIVDEVFSADSFRFSPSFLRRLAVSSFDRGDAFELGESVPQVDVAIDQQVLQMQRTVLAQLLGETIAQRLVNNESKVDAPGDALRLSELHDTLHRAVWSELGTRRDIPLARRNLQREYVVRITTALVRPATSMPADARALARADAVRLRAEIDRTKDLPTRSAEARAHLAESLVALDQALRSPLVRQAI
jgi:hypothetical protein